MREEEEVNYMISIVENLGGDAARQCYWDLGRWSDLWKVWRVAGDDRPFGDGIDFQARLLLFGCTTFMPSCKEPYTIKLKSAALGQLCRLELWHMIWPPLQYRVSLVGTEQLSRKM